MRLALSSAGAGVAVQFDAKVFALLVGHHREVERHGGHTQWHQRAGDAVLDLVAQRATCNGERNQHGDRTIGAHFDIANHAEIDNGTMQFRILNRAQRFDDLFGCGHGRSRREGLSTAITTT